MKKYAFLIVFIILTATINSQSLNPTYAISTSGQADLFSGGYTFSYSSAGTPWNGSLISYGGFTNQYDCQISSEYYTGNHIGFRTRNGDNGTWNSWKEIWHSGNLNNPDFDFIAKNQFVTANLILGQDFQISTISGPGNSGAIQIKTNMAYAGSANRYWRLGWKDNNNLFASVLSINDDLNVGIGTVNPDAKLALNGTIYSKEVKVDMTGWSDFVFKKEYNLPIIEQVEKHIAERDI